MTGRRVLFLGGPALGPARALWRLLERDFTLAGCWYATAHDGGVWERDAWLARHNPAFSLGAALRHAGVAPLGVPTLSRWAGWPAAFEAAAPDLIVSAHFANLVPDPLLRRLPGRALNLHPALLPDYRGPASLAALLADGAGERCAGVTLHLMDAGFDTGAIVAQQPVPLLPSGDAIEWELKVARAYATLIDSGLLPYLAGECAPRPQPPGSGSYATKQCSDIALSSAVPLERARRIVEIFGQWREITYRDGKRLIRAQPPLRYLGPASGQAPLRRWLTVEVDLADARVALRRHISGHGRRLRRRRRRRYAAATT